MFRNIPTVTRHLLVINILAYVATLLLGSQGIDLSFLCGLHYVESPYFGIYQIITYQFLHGSFFHLFFNMFALWMFGRIIEQVMGSARFLVYYLVCGIGAGLSQELVQWMMQSYSLTIGASGAVYGILLAFGMTFPEERIYIFPLPIPIKAKWFVAIYAGIELYSAASMAGDGVAHMAHLGGMLFGFLLITYWRKHPGNYHDIGSGLRFFEQMKKNFEQHRQSTTPGNGRQTASRAETDMEYNARKKQEQDEIDRILDKMKKSGYDGLTEKEKLRLFEAGRNK